MLLERDCNYGLGMDALVSVCSLVSVCFWNAIAIMVWAWKLWLAYALGTRMEVPPHLRKSPAHPPCRVCTTAEYEPCTNYILTVCSAFQSKLGLFIRPTYSQFFLAAQLRTIKAPQTIHGVLDNFGEALLN